MCTVEEEAVYKKEYGLHFSNKNASRTLFYVKRVRLICFRERSYMLKDELKRHLRMYADIRNGLAEGVTEIAVCSSGRQKRVGVAPWAYKLKDIISAVISAETEPLAAEMIELCIVRGKSDKAVLSEMPLSESTFYRWKQRFTEKVYELLIQGGEVSRQEILKNSISEN